MNSFCVLTPAIVDRDCVEQSSISLRENLFEKNKDYKFTHVVQLCDYKRDGYSGNLSEIESIYRDSDSVENCKLVLKKSSPRVGHVMAGYNLFCEFLKTDCEYAVVIEEDTKLMHPLLLDDIAKILKDNSDKVVHLSMGYDYPGMNKWKTGDSGKEDCSSEAFLEEKISIQNNLHVFSNYRNFCSWNGTIFSRELMKKIVASFKPFADENCEDQIGKMPFYVEKEVLTIGSGQDVKLDGGREDFFKHHDWQLPKENHILLEVLRRGRDLGRPGYIG
tara:strand:+ start:20082 stop:20909 length:828 start_codon:yes stop_codon:yes gene_type:complete